jgi:hypothetical protein
MTLSVPDRDHLEAVAQRYGLDSAVLIALASLWSDPTGPLNLGVLAIDPGQQTIVETHQAHAAAELIRDRIDQLIHQGWTMVQFWAGAAYSPEFLTDLAAGMLSQPRTDRESRLTASPLGTAPRAIESSAETLTEAPVQLQPCAAPALIAAYQAQTRDRPDVATLSNQTLDDRLLDYLQRIPRFYKGLVFQRDALLEAIRIWHRSPSSADVLQQLGLGQNNLGQNSLDPLTLDHALIGFVPALAASYRGYPHQRQALILVVQRSQQLPSIEAALQALVQARSPQVDLGILDPLLIAFVQRIPQQYRANADQRNALVEGFAQWHNIHNQSEVLLSLGIGLDLLQIAAEGGQASPSAIAQAAQQLDQALLSFSRQIPGLYQGDDRHRQALLQLIETWTGSPSRSAVTDQLLHDLRRMEQGATIPSAAPPVPQFLISPLPNPGGSADRIEIFASPTPGCPYIWADITQGGRHWPSDPATIDRILTLAAQLNLVCDRLGHRPRITRWYDPSFQGDPHKRHAQGDGLDCYVEGLLAEQLYWALDPWWPGALGCDRQVPYLLYLDLRGHRVRWRLATR